MPRCSAIYVLTVLSTLHFHLHFYRHNSSFAYFLEYVVLSLDDNVNQERE